MSVVDALLLGTAVGAVFGVLPIVGATLGLVVVYPFLDSFQHIPYVGAVFLISLVASSSVSDTVSSVLLGIPGANSSSASIMDGFPLAQRGYGHLALVVAVIASVVNGCLWIGVAAVAYSPLAALALNVFIPDFLYIYVLSFLLIAYVASDQPVLSFIALCIGGFIGLIGLDSAGAPRFTFGWPYLEDGVQIAPLVAGLFGFPELLGLKNGQGGAQFRLKTRFSLGRLLALGLRLNWRFRADGLRGGLIGAGIGILPGIGGAIADWLAYSQTILLNPKERFGNGNLRGLVGCEGANNSHKATALVPTLVFGIPGAPYAAILIAYFSILGFDVGSYEFVADRKFFELSYGSFLFATILGGAICLVTVRWIARIRSLGRLTMFILVGPLLLYACVQYTGNIDDYIILLCFTILGISCKILNIPRICILFSFIIIERLEKTILQYFSIYGWNEMFNGAPRWLLFCCVVVVSVLILRKSLDPKVRIKLVNGSRS